ncbi:MAG: threonylcarbamoyl-AMP synthase [Bacilli bacterium]|nr:threonylcarbamoyl-AMP synthase [Bacilli bacterium]
MKELTEKEVGFAAEILKNEEILAFPTETVYGVGVIYDSKLAFDRLVALKRRPPAKPFALMCSSIEEAYKYIEVNEKQAKLMEYFLPGEITFLVKSRPDLPEWVTLGTNVIGIRVPDSEYVYQLIKRVGKPCLVTSANKSGEPTSSSYEDTKEAFKDELPAIVKGTCVSKIPTTIVSMMDNDVKLVREGPISFEEITEYWRFIQ